MNVVTFGDHLRADEQVKFPLVKSVESTFEIFVAAYRIAVEAGDARLRKHAVQQLFQFLRTSSQKVDVLAAAVYTGLRHGRGVTTVVADHFVLALVMGKRDGTVGTFEFLAAGPAENDGRISAAVEQDHHLLVTIEPLFYFGGKLARDHLFVACF